VNLVFNFLEEEFICLCANNIQRQKTTVYQDIYEAITHFISTHFCSDSNITKIKHIERYQDEYLSITNYINQGFIEIYYLGIDIFSEKEYQLKINNIILPNFIKIAEEQGSTSWKSLKIKEYNLKTKNRVTLELHHIKITNDIINRIIDRIDKNIEIIQPSCLGAWEWRQTFYNKITGVVFFCKCFETAIQKNSLRENNYNSHIHLQTAIDNQSFKKGVCHLCSKNNSDLFYCNPMYGSAFKVKYGAYIKKIEIETGITEREAENIVRQEKGVAKIGEKWINETLLFNYIQVLFPEYTVKREASPDWIGRQRLDIYIPEINLAIEYQGEQHFKAIDIFGGKDALKIAKARDKEKLEKCIANNVNLVYFSYKDNLSEKLVITRLSSYLRKYL
jgi:hypothetical protein